MDEQQRAELAAKVRETRKGRGWSQARLAKEAGVSENTVMHLEQGKKATQDGKVRLILDALGIAPLSTVIDMEGVPEDVQIFVTVAVQRLKVMDEIDRQWLLTNLYPMLIARG